MGEYAKRASDGVEVKIGTCENMYYLRAEQRKQVRALHGNVNPASADALALRFRFPWPDEDGVQIGEFDPYERAITVPGMAASVEVEHYSVQFVAQAGYVVSLPCPEGHPQQAEFLTIHRNGFAGAVQLVQQKLLADGRLVPVLRCGGCGAKWRVEEQTEIEAVAVAFRSEGDKRKASQWHEENGQRVDTGDQFWHQIADRVLLGALLKEAV